MKEANRLHDSKKKKGQANREEDEGEKDLPGIEVTKNGRFPFLWIIVPIKILCFWIIYFVYVHIPTNSFAFIVLRPFQRRPKELEGIRKKKL